MDDIYTFGQRRYIPAEPLEVSIKRTMQNLSRILIGISKCVIFGAFILLKSFVYLLIPTESKDIKSQVALVTGGANGIGRAICIELAKCGCNIAVVDVDRDGALNTVNELHLLGVKAFPYECDVSNYNDVLVLKEKIQVDLGDVDILVNNAGLLTKISLLQGKPEDILRAVNVNLVSQFWTIRVFMPGMLNRGRGHTVAIASILAFESSGRAICYAATKFGIRGLMDGLYDLSYLDDLNLNVTTVFPALVNTRKEFIEQFIDCHGLNSTAELLFYTPQQIAMATVDGLLKNKKYVVFPAYFAALHKLITLLPEDLQRLIRDCFAPKIGPEFNEAKESKPTRSIASLYIN